MATEIGVKVTAGKAARRSQLALPNTKNEKSLEPQRFKAFFVFIGVRKTFGCRRF